MDDKNIKTTDWLIKGIPKFKLMTMKILALLSATIEIEQSNRKMNNKEFAKYMGISKHTLSKWKSGKYNFSISELVYIFDKLELRFNPLPDKDYSIESDNSDVKSTN